jgi:hypothetical protein
MSSSTPFRRRAGRAAAGVLAVALVIVTVAALAGCGATAGTGAGSAPRTASALPLVSRAADQGGPRDSFLTVSITPSVLKGSHSPFVAWVVRYQVQALQLRSLSGGRVIRTLLRSLGTISAAPAPDGMIIAVENYGCRSQVLRIDPATGHATMIRVLPQYADDVTVSPDGQFLAYLTYPAAQACTPVRQPARPVRTVINPGGPAQFLPSVVAVVNLATGATVRAATRNPGNPPFGLAWSPDGTMIATVDSADNSIALLSATHPDFSTARRIDPPRGCGFVTSTWTRSGLIAVEGCGKQNVDLSPRKLVQISPSGRPGAAWQLAACISGVTVLTDPAARHVLVEENLGYGNGRPCGVPKPGGYEIRIAQVRGNRLQTVAAWPTGPVQLMLAGW